MFSISYFNILKQKNKYVFIFLHLVHFLIFPFIILTGRTNNFLENSVSSIIVLFFSIIYLIFSNFSFTKIKTEADMQFSLPIKRKKIFNTAILNILYTALVPFFINLIISYIISVIFKNYSEENILHINTKIIYILFSVYLVMAWSSLLLFVYMKSRNIVDALIGIFGYILIPSVLVNNLMYKLNSFIYGFSLKGEILYSYTFIGNILKSFMIINDLKYTFGIRDMVEFLVMGIVMIFSIKFTLMEFEKYKVEDTEKVTKSKAIYPFMINFGTFSMIALVSYDNFYTQNIFLLTMVFIIYLIIKFIQNRKINLRPMILIQFVLILLINLAISQLIYSTRVFGLPYIYPKTKYVSIEISTFNNGKKDYLSEEELVIFKNLEQKDFDKIIYSFQDSVNDNYYNISRNKLQEKYVEDTYDDFEGNRILIKIRYYNEKFHGDTERSYFYEEPFIEKKNILKMVNEIKEKSLNVKNYENLKNEVQKAINLLK